MENTVDSGPRPAADAAAPPRDKWFPAWLHSGQAALLFIAASYACLALASWCAYTHKIKAPLAVLWGVVLAFLLILPLLIWSGSWAFASRLYRQKSYFFAHINILLSGGLVNLSVGYALGALGFAFDIERRLVLPMAAANGLVFAWILAGHLFLASHFRRRTIWLVSFGIVGAFFGAATLSVYAMRKNYAMGPDKDLDLFPAFFKMVESRPAEKHLAVLEKIKKNVDALASTPPGPQPSPSQQP